MIQIVHIVINQMWWIEKKWNRRIDRIRELVLSSWQYFRSNSFTDNPENEKNNSDNKKKNSEYWTDNGDRNSIEFIHRRCVKKKFSFLAYRVLIKHKANWT